jgi:hypothetical protein
VRATQCAGLGATLSRKERVRYIYIPLRKQTGRKDKESNKKIRDQRLKSPGRRRKVYSIYL